MNNFRKDADFRDYELYQNEYNVFLEELRPNDEELEIWLEEMHKQMTNKIDKIYNS